ncbi:hypothetical protein SALBM217S_03343 [Streptomyces griseoloalbus]
MPLALARDALEVDGIRLGRRRWCCTQPAPALHLPPQSVAVTNYAPLQAQTGAPAVRITWIALKLDPELCPEAVAARGGGLHGAQKCVVRVADHLASRLAGAGFRATVLDEEELISAVATSACANPLVTAESGRAERRERRTEESSRSWRCDNRRDTTYWIRKWPSLGGAHGPSLHQFVARITGVHALATTISLTLAPGDRREMSLTGHLRVTGRSADELTEARRALEAAARDAGAALTRLDREQLPGVLATLPLGGARRRPRRHRPRRVRAPTVGRRVRTRRRGARRPPRTPAGGRRVARCGPASACSAPATDGTPCPWTTWTPSRCPSATTASSSAWTPRASPPSWGSTGPRRTTSCSSAASGRLRCSPCGPPRPAPAWPSRPGARRPGRR